VVGFDRSALLEREPEFRRLAAALSAGEGGAGGTLLIEGAAGIGKSRLSPSAVTELDG
jgi:predicted ATPase